MKKIITILMAVCLMVSVLGVSALAEDAVYTGPKTHSYPTLIDFNNELASTNASTNGKNFYNTQVESKNFYYFQGYTKVWGTTDVEAEVRVWGAGGAGANNAIKFDDFDYVETDDGKQPQKLVVSFDAKYIMLDDPDPAQTTRNLTDFGLNHDHIYFANKNIVVGEENYFGNMHANNHKIIADNGDKRFFNWSYNVDTDNDVVDGVVYNAGVSMEQSTFSNYAISKVNGGEWFTYTYVLDLTRDVNEYGNVIVYVDDVKSDVLTSRVKNVDTINALMFGVNKQKRMAYDNVRIYTIDNNKIAATSQSVAETNVPVTTEEVTVNFSHEITSAADNYIVVKKGSETLIPGLDYTIEHVYSTEPESAKTAKAFKVKFNDDLSLGTTYTIGGSAEYFGIDGYALEEETTFASFTTELPPQINLSEISVKKGFFGNVDVTNLADALGSTVSVTTTASNGEVSGTATGTVFFGVYKNGVLVNLAFVKKTFAEGESDLITVNLDLPAATESDTVELKAFACEGLGNLDAYGTVRSLSTAN